MPAGKLVLLKLRGVFVDIMCKVNPEHKPNITYEKGKPVLYLKVLKAIYGCIESALLWFNLYSNTLQKLGFEINPYDRCVANKMINGKQCTVVWYVDDNKISHMDQAVLDDLIKTLKDHFGDLKVVKGNKHEFLGMNIIIHDDGKVEYEMKKQLQEAIDAFDDDVTAQYATPAGRTLFETKEETSKLLSEKRQENFHSVTAKLLYLMKRARPDIDVAVTYLCSRVSKPNESDWEKLKRVLCYIKSTMNETRFMGMDDLGMLFTWIDAAYAVHPNMRSQTGGAMSMGTGVIHAKSGKQKLNVKSSTEAELVGVSEYLPFNLWTRHFMESQGYALKSNVVYQDNQSAIKMEKNGRNSCTGNSRHIHIRYFFVKDRIDKGEVKIEYCPTLQMLADFYTKPLQGTLFRKFWRVIMGRDHINSLKENDSASDIKERVENVRLISDRENNSDAKNIANEKGREEKRSWSDVVRGSSRKVEENGSEGLGNCKPTDQRDDGSSH